MAGGIKLFGVDDLGGELGRPEVRNEERRAVAIGETWGDSEGMLLFIKGREVCEQWMLDPLEGNREKISCIVFETEFVNKYMYVCMPISSITGMSGIQVEF